MFVTGKGTSLDTQNIVSRFFKPLLKRADLLDDLRAEITWAFERTTHPRPLQSLDALDGLERGRWNQLGAWIGLAHAPNKLARV